MIDPASFRAAMGNFVTGVAIVTTCGADGPTGMTVNSLTSVSLSPCQLLVCLKRDSYTGAIIRESGTFAVNLLAGEQRDLAQRFARPGADRFENVGWHKGPLGLPLFDESLAHLVCRLDRVHEGGDHEIFVGTVEACTQAEADPLIFFRGRFGLPAHA